MSPKKSPLEQAGEELHWNLILASVVYLILGLVLVLRPYYTSLFLGYIIGAALTGYGLFYFISFFSKATKTGATVLIGVLSTAFGVYTLINPTAFEGILFITFGILIVLNSLVTLRQAALMKSLSFSGWWVLGLLAVLTTIVGFLLIFNFEWFGRFLQVVTGGVMIYEALSGLWSVHRIYVLKKNFHE